MEKYERVAHAADKVYVDLISILKTLKDLSDKAHLTGLYIDYKGEPTAEELRQLAADICKWADELESEED